MATTTARPSEHKRAACDRCRNQKLRCSGEDQIGTKCHRCARAGAECNFSASLKAGKPASAKANPSNKRKDNVRSSKRAMSWEAVAHEPEEHAFDDMLQDDFFEQSLGDAFGIATPGSLGGNSIVNRRIGPSIDAVDFHHCAAKDNPIFLPAEQLDFGYGIENANMNAPGSYPVNFEPLTDVYNYSPQQDQRPDPSDTSWISMCGQGSNAENNTKPAGTSSGKISQLVSQGGSSMYQTDPSETTEHRMEMTEDRMDWDSSHEHQQMRTKSNDQTAVAATPQDIRQQRMQELSQLSMTIYTHLTTLPNGDKTSSHSLKPLASKVLASSVDFLSLLTTLYSSSHTLTTNDIIVTDPQYPSDEEDNLDCSSGNSSDDMDISSSNPPASRSKAYTSGRCHRRKRTRSSSSRAAQRSPADQAKQDRKGTNNCVGNQCEGQHQPADMTEVFAILTCYIRLLHLHSLLYANISETLNSSPSLSSPCTSFCPCNKGGSEENPFLPGTTVSKSEPSRLAYSTSSILATLQKQRVPSTQHPPPSTTPPLFPGLSLSGVSLDHFAKFQIKFLLQITTHTLGEIEHVLGLPEGYRISRRRDNHRFPSAEKSDKADVTDSRRHGGGSDGILGSACVSKSFVEVTMKERGLRTGALSASDGGRRRSGKGGGGGGDGGKASGRRVGTETGTAGCDLIDFIGESLIELRGLLKGTINP